MAYVGKPIGARKLTFFPLIDGTDTDLIPAAYAAAIKLSRLIDITITPVFAEGSLESDDGVEDDTSVIIAYDVSITASQLTDYIRSTVLGHEYDAGGGMLVNGNDVAKLGALAWEELISSKSGAPKYKKVVLYKGKFKEFAEKAETVKQGGVTYQTHPITGRFYRRDYDANVKYSMREDSPEADATKLANWFTAPQESTETYSTTVATPVASPVTGAIASGTDVALTCETAGADIYYTTDGSTPTPASTKYSTAIDLTAATVIKAIAIKSGMNKSLVGTFIYTLTA